MPPFSFSQIFHIKAGLQNFDLGSKSCHGHDLDPIRLVDIRALLQSPMYVMIQAHTQ